jgi:hypothetical protein
MSVLNPEIVAKQIRALIGAPQTITLPADFSDGLTATVLKISELPIPEHDRQCLITATEGLATTIGNSLRHRAC